MLNKGHSLAHYVGVILNRGGRSVGGRKGRIYVISAMLMGGAFQK